MDCIQFPKEIHMRIAARIASMALATSVAAVALPFTIAQAQEIGVPSCDGFLKTYQACVASKVAAENRGPMNTALEQLKANWKAVAASADGKAKLDQTCKDTAEQMKKQVAALNCAW
jgi:hypothetical protein